MSVAAASTLPDLQSIKNVLIDLIGKDVQIKDGPQSRIPPTTPFILALYKSPATKTAVAAICDLAFATYGGAALSLIPKGAAEESLRSGKLSDVLAENFHEILNVLTTTLNHAGTEHYALGQVILPPEKITVSIAKGLANPRERRNAEISIEKYGAGQLILVKFPLA